MDNFICVYDFETDGPNPEICEPVQLASCMINPITLTVVPDSEFCSYMKPEGIENSSYYDDHKDTITWHAKNYNPDFVNMSSEEQELAVKKIFNTWKEAPDQKQIWTDFTTYLLKYNKNQSRKSKFTAPIRAGANIRRFDNVIVQRLCARYNFLTKDGEQKIFHPRDVIDIMELAFYWFENLPEPKAYNMNELMQFFGMSTSGAHDALVDIRNECAMIQKFMNLHRKLARKVNFKNAMANS